MSCVTRTLTLLSALPTGLAAQTLMGRIIDSAAHHPISSVTVRLVRSVDSVHDTVVASTQTNAAGEFLIEAPTPGTYRLRFGDTQAGLPITLANVDAVDQHEYVLAPTPPASRYHVLHGAELDSAVAAGTPLLACQVSAEVEFVPGTVNFPYPERPKLRDAPGSLLAEFVVDTLGQIEPGTVRISRAEGTHKDFEGAVTRGLGRARFSAAVADGRKVRQRVFLPVMFSMDDDSWPSPLDAGPCGPIGRQRLMRAISQIFLF